MAVQVHIENIFATPIYTSIIDIDLGEFDIENYSMNPSSPHKEDLLLISDDEQILRNPEFNHLKSIIDLHMENFYYNILQYKNNTYPDMTTSWLVQSLPGQQSESHFHANSIFCGVFYLKVPENSGNLIFSTNHNDDRNLTSYLDPQVEVQNQYNKRIYSLEPKENMLVLFPSTIRHAVETNRSNQERISLAFNYFIKGEFRNRAGKLFLK